MRLRDVVPEPDRDWRLNAECRGTDTQTFFPRAGMEGHRRWKRLCDACPVRGDCLADAILRDEHYGVWGGLIEDDRDRVASRLRAGVSWDRIVVTLPRYGPVYD